MKNIAFSIVVISIHATAAIAGGVETPTPTATVIALPAASSTDWSGLYLGAFASTEAGVFTYFPSGDMFDLTGNMAGGFAGYNIQRGNLVFGGEVNYSAGTVALETSPTLEYSNLIDVNARIGYTVGRALVYATVGGSFGDWNEEITDTTGMFSASGFNYGIGVDFMVTEKIFVGAAYINREMSGSFGAMFPGESLENNNQSLRVRAGIQF